MILRTRRLSDGDHSRRAPVHPRSCAGASMSCPRSSSISANVSADDSAGMPDGGSRHAATCDEGPTWTASETNQRRHSIRLLKRRKWHSVRRCCERQRKGNSDQPDHCSLPCEPFKKEGAKAGHQCDGFRKVPAQRGRRIACPPDCRRSEGPLTKIETANSAMAVGTCGGSQCWIGSVQKSWR